MNANAQALSLSHTVSNPPNPEVTLQIIEDALSDPHSPVNNLNHPWHKESVAALRRLQLQLMDPSHPETSELDIKRLTMPSFKAQMIKDNIRFHGSAIGKATEPDVNEELCVYCGSLLSVCGCEFVDEDEDW